MKLSVLMSFSVLPYRLCRGTIEIRKWLDPQGSVESTGRQTFVNAIVLILGMLAASGLAARAPFERLDVVSGDYSGLPPQTAAHGPEFGYSVAISGEWMAVGAPATIVNASGDRDGVVFMFRNQGDDWLQTQRIQMAVGGDDPRCGHSVALSGSHLIVGCPGATGVQSGLEGGTTRLFMRDSNDVWQTSTGYSGTAGNRCGTAVDITSFVLSQTTPVLAVTGCPQDDSAKGRAIILPYDGNAWGQGTSILASDGVSGDTFGSAVALTVSCDSGPIGISCQPRLVVGAPTKGHDSAILGGAAYVYAGSDWTETDVFTHEVPSSFGATFFGSAVDINASQLLVGVPGGLTTTCPDAPRCGRLRHWARDGSNWDSQFSGGAINAGGVPPGEQVGMRFSHAVALGFDNWVAIGAPMTDGSEDAFGNPVEGLGLVELRRAGDGDWGTNWSDTRQELRPGNFSLTLNYDDSQFGHSLAFGGGRWLAVGVPRWTTLPFPGVRRGQVWLYAPADRIFSDRFDQ